MEEQLIELVRTRELIWNIKSKSYRLSHLKSKAWADISSKLNISVDRAQKRWKSLRDKFKVEKNKTANLKSGSAAIVEKSTWKYYDQLRFLNDSLEKRKTYTVYDETEDPQNFETFNVDAIDEIIEESVEESPPNISMEEDSISCFCTPLESTPASFNTGKRTSLRSKVAQRNQSLVRAEEQFSNLVDTVKNIIKPKNSMEAFFYSIMTQVQEANLNQNQWLRLQEQIFSVTMNIIRQNAQDATADRPS